MDNAASVKDIYGRGVHPAVKAILQARKLPSSGRPAAVLVLVSADGAVTDPAEADLLLTVRASTLRQHSGQVSFPGGATGRATAARWARPCVRPRRKRAWTPPAYSR